MKIYEYRDFPNPRRVRLFLAEKGIGDIDFQQVDVTGREHRSEPFLAKNPFAGLPVLELDDGSYLSETVAICRYFEARHPSPSLMGRTAEEVARIEMWQRRAEETLLNPLLAYFHHATPGLGPLEAYQNRDWGLKSRGQALAALAIFDDQLKRHPYLAGEAFSIADITALSALDLGRALDVGLPEGLDHLHGWYDRVSRRASAGA
ncbi:MAG: glutathione S-transferase [Alphaproteobacteria bacterium]|jgi:glutathione S-transferase|nr:glutathione S-transferase [Alphaproteobacteria bacterium]